MIDSLTSKQLASQVRQKAQGSTDCPFWMHVADEIERLTRERDAWKSDSVELQHRLDRAYGSLHQIKYANEDWTRADFLRVASDGMRNADETPAELDQLRRVDQAARAFVNAVPESMTFKGGQRAFAALCDALFDGRPSEETDVRRLNQEMCKTDGHVFSRIATHRCFRCGTEVLPGAYMEHVAASKAPAVQREWHFDRYRNGRLMAQGVKVVRAASEEDAREIARSLLYLDGNLPSDELRLSENGDEQRFSTGDSK